MLIWTEITPRFVACKFCTCVIDCSATEMLPTSYLKLLRPTYLAFVHDVTVTSIKSGRRTCKWITRYHKLQPKPKTIAELKDALQSIWDDMPRKPIKKAVRDGMRSGQGWTLWTFNVTLKVELNNSKRLLKNLQKMAGDYFFVAHPVFVYWYSNLHTIRKLSLNTWL